MKADIQQFNIQYLHSIFHILVTLCIWVVLVEYNVDICICDDCKSVLVYRNVSKLLKSETCDVLGQK